MDRDISKGHIAIDFAAEPFDSAPRLLLRSAELFLSSLPFLTAVTLIVYLPAKAAIQGACHLLNVPTEGILSYVVWEIGDLVLSALVIPAAIYGLVAKLGTGKPGGVRDALRWGWRQWGRLLWNKVKVEITVTLWALLLIVPGVIAMVKLAVTDAVVAVEGDRCGEPLQRSRELTAGRGWRTFGVVLPFLILDLIGGALVLSVPSRLGMALADGALAVVEQWFTAAVLMMYLGTAATTHKGRTKDRR